MRACSIGTRVRVRVLLGGVVVVVRRVGVLTIVTADVCAVPLNVSVDPSVGLGGETQSEKGERNEMLRHALPSGLPITQARSVLRGVTISKG